jgi:hypothetical protein
VLSQWYRMRDSDPDGVMPVTQQEAHSWNERQWGIFATVNEFDGPRRIANLRRICAWAVDIDDGTKEEQAARIVGSPLWPSLVVETKRGYQVYWRAKDATVPTWNEIVLERLVPYFGADLRARDIARILRVPGFLHWKDPANPFRIRTVWEWDVAYHEAALFDAFTSKAETEKHAEHFEAKAQWRSVDGDGFWDRLYNFDCAAGLQFMSGHSAVKGERFTFRRVTNGNRNILVNGKGTSCWIDKHGRIGSLDKGGPTLFCWLRWYGHADRECVRVLKELFPELEAKS